MVDIRQKQNKKGVVLLVVMGTVFIVIFLANVVLRIIGSQSRLTHHQVSRIQAYYASMAGVNYALERLRTGTWNANSCPDTSSCKLSVLDSNFSATFPNSVSEVNIVITPPQSTNPNAPCYNPPGNTACVDVTTDYAYTQ